MTPTSYWHKLESEGRLVYRDDLAEYWLNLPFSYWTLRLTEEERERLVKRGRRKDAKHTW